MDKLLPQNLEAEQVVLGCILNISEAFDQVRDILDAADFYRDAHRTIYEAMIRLYNKREPVDLITLENVLKQDDKLDQVGGFSYLIELTNSAWPTSGHAEYYARIIATKAQHRRRIHASGRIAAFSYEEADDAQVRSEQALAEVELGRKSDFSPLSDVLLECMNDFDQMKGEPGSIIGVPTGFRGLDAMTGGLQKSDLIILAGRPGEGKTTLAQNIAYRAMLTFGMRIAFFSLEMSKKQLAYRFIAMDSLVDSQRLRLNHINDETNEWKRIVDTVGALADGRLWIDDTAGLDIDVMRSRSRRLHSQHQVDLVIVDYLQQMTASINGKRPAIREQEVSEIAQKLKQVARDLNVPVLALAQMSREIERRGDKKPQLSDLRESGRLEQEADIVMFLHREENAKGKVDLLVEKQRNGPTGTVTLGFESKYTRFFNVDEQGREIA